MSTQDKFLGFGLDRVEFVIMHEGFPYNKKRQVRHDIKQKYGHFRDPKVIDLKYFKDQKRSVTVFIERPFADQKLDDGRGLLKVEVSLRYPFQAYIYMNCNLLWRYENFDYRFSGHYKQNYLDVDVKRRQQQLYQIFIKYRKRAIEFAKMIWRRIFKFQVYDEKIEVFYQSAEITEEYIAVVEDFLDAFYRVRARVFHTENNETRTTYANDLPVQNVQLKVYQKTMNMARVEWTYHNELAQKLFASKNWREMAHKNEYLLKDIKEQIGYNSNILEKLTPSKFEIMIAKAHGRPVEEMKALLTTKKFRSNRHTSYKIRKLAEKGYLQQLGKKGDYYPSMYLEFLQSFYAAMKEEIPFDSEFLKAMPCQSYTKGHTVNGKSHGHMLCTKKRYHRGGHIYKCRVCGDYLDMRSEHEKNANNE